MPARYAQVSLFDTLSQPGDYVEAHGFELTFDQVAQMVGRLIVLDCSTENHEWFQVVLVENIIQNEDGRRLIYYDGKRQRGLVNERYFSTTDRFRARAYMVAV